MKTILFGFAFTLTFCLGFAFKSATLPQNDPPLKRVTGIGGIFFKSKNPKKALDWYKTHLGLDANPYGATFEWYEGPDSSMKAQTQWNPFPENSNYFGDSGQDFMINYRVADLEALIVELKKEGVTLVDEMESFDYGKFVHILDGDGNKVELWEAID